MQHREPSLRGYGAGEDGRGRAHVAEVVCTKPLRGNAHIKVFVCGIWMLLATRPRPSGLWPQRMRLWPSCMLPDLSGAAWPI